jgi:ADP-L-glycero-D-manno-heptose 6-epimerase
MFIVTGGAGFIGSYMVYWLNKKGFDQIYIVDVLENEGKWKNLRGLKFKELITPECMQKEETKQRFKKAEAIFHLGACSSTTETNADYLYQNNFQYSVMLFDFATYNNIPFYYASSAATYGEGALGYADDHGLLTQLRALNPYGYSKQLFDEWVLSRKHHPTFWNGFKFFNVYGPNEYHKTHMCSVVYKAFQQIQKMGTVQLFKSHQKDYADGEQKRDFVYVDDVCSALWNCFEFKQQRQDGIINLGSGIARSFNDLVKATFSAMQKEVNIDYIPMPESIRDQYQYFTEAPMKKLYSYFPQMKLRTLEEGVELYVRSYLMQSNNYTDLQHIRE